MGGLGERAGARTADALLAEDAFRAFYAIALPRVYGYFRSRAGGSASIAEDLTQETFLAAVRELRRGQGVEDPMSWLIGIARHKLIDHYRAQERYERVLQRAIDDQQSTTDWPDLGTEFARERVIESLAIVPAMQRAALALRYMDGLSVPEVARAMGKSVHAAESLIARGKQSLKRVFFERRDD
jgi:RNA polymerase sigma-70 factor (ECF subfamily)